MRNRHSKQEPELNITAFLNLMVVLIPFLLLNAVFTQLSVIELNLPKQSDAASTEKNENDDKPPFDLQVILLKNKVILFDAENKKDLKVLELKDGSYDTKELHDTLKTLKTSSDKATQENSIRILASQDTSYELVINTMDAVRYYDKNINGQLIKYELFPKISLGNAPISQNKTSQGGRS